MHHVKIFKKAKKAKKQIVLKVFFNSINSNKVSLLL